MSGKGLFYLLGVSATVLTAAWVGASDAPRTNCPGEFRNLALDISRIESSLSKLFEPNETIQAELRRLDRILATEIQESLHEIPVPQQERLLKLVEEADQTHPHGPEAGGLSRTDFALIQTGLRETLRLRIQERILNHPLARIVLRHEFSHLTRLDIGDVPVGAAEKRLARLTRTQWNWSMKEETLAYGDQYDFIRKAYQPSDLEALRKEFPTHHSPETQQLMISKGMLKIGPNGKRMYTFDGRAAALMARDPRLVAAYLETLEHEVNFAFLSFVEEAFRLSKDEYVKHFLSDPDYKAAARYGNMWWVVHKMKIAGYPLSAGVIAYQLKEFVAPAQIKPVANPSLGPSLVPQP